MLRKIPIGVSDFKKVITNNNYYIDKSLFIQDIINDGAEVLLVPRPRRFGKTLNLSMLKYFFDREEKDNLFTQLKIWDNSDCHSERGRYPVVFLTLKDVKADNYENCMFKIKETISTEISRFKYLLVSEKINELDKSKLKKIMDEKSETIEYESILRTLSRCLETHHGEKTVILIDEYDIPIQNGFLFGYYNDIIDFMRNFLSSALKDNPHLKKSVVTGILRVSKESIFSGLNNLKVSTILDRDYSDRFGLLEEEVFEMLKYYNSTASLGEIKKWYNGYTFGTTTVYNPWSIINFVDKQNSQPQPFWVNTSSNDLIKHLMTIGESTVKSELELLIQGKSIKKKIDSNIVMSEIENSNEALWSLLLFSGYLKAVKQEQINRALYCELMIPNEEVLYLFETIISSWFSETIKPNKYKLMLKSLVTGDYSTFGKVLNDFVIASMSYFDPTGDDSEKVYHAFVLGLLVDLSGEYDIRSNRESGYGRYDVCMFPKDISKRGIIFEFKKVDHYDEETLEIACQQALKQIEEKEYAREIREMGVLEVVGIGIGFEGKNIKLGHKML